jgi:hypothetical protein
MAEKVSKQSVDYSQGMKARHCGICRYFEPPHACEKVEGRIETDKWCRLFKSKPQTIVGSR